MQRTEESNRDWWESQRDDGRYTSTEGFIHQYIKNNEPELSFDPEMSAEEMDEWREEVRETLLELMAFPEFEEEQPDPKQVWTKPRDGYELQRWEAFPEPKCVVPFLMLVPDSVDPTDPHPTVMCFPGSSRSKEYVSREPEIDTGEVENGKIEHNQMARHFAKDGMIAIAVENPITGELIRGSDEVERNERRNTASANLIGYGRNYVGLSVYQKTRILEWAKTRDIVDTERLAVAGHSLGTEPAMVMGVLDEDIEAMVFNDFVCYHRNRVIARNRPSDPYNDGGGIWHLIPEFYRWFDFPDLLAAFAPRHLFIGEGGPPEEIQPIKEAYETVGHPENIAVYYYDAYSDPETKQNEYDGVPEGMTEREYREYSNVDVSQHYFHEYYALPWIDQIF